MLLASLRQVQRSVANETRTLLGLHRVVPETGVNRRQLSKTPRVPISYPVHAPRDQ
jgi:hypothetical protein